tara:strand:- start:91 stop:2820 length:2730 start_codon:yes stop_codon:yes gene_type:complete
MVNIYLEGQLLDQYKDEVIEITSSVLDVGDITKNTGDFSKTFTIPASPNNNKIFKHWYNASIDNGFDARTKVAGHIDIDGVPFKTGKWRLSEATFKDGVVDGYIINFFGNLPNIKDTIGDDLLSDINFSTLNHEWIGDNVMDGLTGDLLSTTHTQREIIYTPISTKRYFYNSNALADEPVNNINIANVGAATGITWNDLRPSLKAKTIIDSIQHKYGTGTHQVVKIQVTGVPINNGVINLTLNGLPTYELGMSSTATTTGAASQIATKINFYASSIYTATSSGSIVTITSNEMEQEFDPSSFTTGADGLAFNMYVSVVGAFPYENPIVFSNDFFQTSEFEQMYLWLKRDDDEDIGFNESVVEWNGGDLTDINADTNVVTMTNTKTIAPGGAITDNYEYVVLRTSEVAGYENVPFTLVRKTKTTDVDGVVTYTEDEHPAYIHPDGEVGGIGLPRTYRTNRFGTTTYEVQYSIKANTTFRVNLTLERKEYTRLNSGTPALNNTRNTQATPSQAETSTVRISDIMPDMKISDFLKGVFDMFKLVVVPQEDGSMLVNSLDSFYNQGNRYDISDKVDYSTFKVKRGELYQSIAYQFEDPSTILNEEFKNRSRDKQSYGSSLVNVYESIRPIKLIDGEKVEIKLPFEQVIYERLTDFNSSTSDNALNISSATITDKDLKAVTPKPILHYISEQDLTDCPIKFVDENGVITIMSDKMLMPMNQFGTFEPAYSLLFESEVSSWDGSTLSNNLYTIHHEDYISAVFELKRRSFEYEALLPTQMVTRLGLNDVLTIEGIDYRINKFKHNLLEGTTKLDLINGFDTTLYKGVYIPSEINMSKYKSTLYFNVPRIASDYTITKVDTGDGVSFLTIGISGSDNNMALIKCNSVNTTSLTRSCDVNYSDGTTTTIVTVVQLPE